MDDLDSERDDPSVKDMSLDELAAPTAIALCFERNLDAIIEKCKKAAIDELQELYEDDEPQLFERYPHARWEDSHWRVTGNTIVPLYRNLFLMSGEEPDEALYALVIQQREVEGEP